MKHVLRPLSAMGRYVSGLVVKAFQPTVAHFGSEMLTKRSYVNFFLF